MLPSVMHWYNWVRKICSSIARETGKHPYRRWCSSAAVHRSPAPRVCPRGPFQSKNHRWQQSMMAETGSPVTLPAKFPLLLAQGVEGIAVGLASKILPHSPLELDRCSISHLKKWNHSIVPLTFLPEDFRCIKSNNGLRGGATSKSERKSKI